MIALASTFLQIAAIWLGLITVLIGVWIVAVGQDRDGLAFLLVGALLVLVGIYAI